MADAKYHIFKLSDQRVVEALQAIASEAGVPTSAKITVSLLAGNIDATLTQIQDNPEYQELAAANAALSQQISLNSYAQGYIAVTRQATHDEATIRFVEQHVNSAFAVKFLTAVARHLPTYGRTEATDKVLGEELAEFYRRREQGLLQLEGFTQNLLQRNAEACEKFEKEFDERKRQLQAETDAQKQALEDEHSARLAKLEEREQALEARAKDLDDRDSRHVRREIRKDLKKALAERSNKFELSGSTVQKRYVIHGLFVLLLAATLAILWGALPTTKEDYEAADFWLRVGKSALATLGFAMTAAFYIRWNDWWFRQHADEEFKLKRLELDIDRASWVVEMALEWKREKDAGPIPAAIMEGVTRNLFEDPISTRPTHPAEDALATLLGASAGAVVKMPGGSELRFDRRSKKVLEKADSGE